MKIYLNNLLHKCMNENIIIISISFIILNICLFSHTGIIHNVRSFSQENIQLQQKYISMQNKIIVLKQQINLLHCRNIELIEEINYKYKNLLPYTSYKMITL